MVCAVLQQSHVSDVWFVKMIFPLCVVCVHVCMFVCTCVCICMHMCVHACVCMYTSVWYKILTNGVISDFDKENFG